MNRENSSNNQQDVSSDQEPLNSLQEASQALQLAFERIRQVRRNIVQLSQSLPSASDSEREPLLDSTEATSREQLDIGPRHDALVLTGGAPNQAEEESESPESQELQNSYAALTGSNSLETLLNPRSTSGGVVPPRFLRPSRAAPATAARPDSAFTTRGLRVLSEREANSGASVSNTPLSGTRENLTAHYTSILNEYQRTLDHHRAVLARAMDRLPQRQSTDSSDVVSTPPVAIPPNPVAAALQTRNPRAYNLIYAGQQPPPNAPNRLTVLPEPPIVPRTRTLSSSWASATNLNREFGPLPSQPHEQTDTQNPFTLPTSDSPSSAGPAGEQFISWLFPARDHPPSLVPRRDPQNPDTIRVTRAGDLNIPRQRSRRTWARLDPDGNEIPWEEELERMRRETRLPAVRQDPDTRERGHVDENVGDLLGGSSLSCRTPSPVAEAPKYINPLPMPLSSMIMKEDLQDEGHPDVIVPTYACLAGR